MATGEKARLFGDIEYAARNWKYARRVIVKAEHSRRGSNPRFVVTNLQGAAQALYSECRGCCADDGWHINVFHVISFFHMEYVANDKFTCREPYANLVKRNVEI